MEFVVQPLLASKGIGARGVAFLYSSPSNGPLQQPLQLPILLQSPGQFLPHTLPVVNGFADLAEGQRRCQEGDITCECLPVDKVGLRVGVVGHPIRNVPTYGRCACHGDPRFSPPVPCGDGHGNEVENEEAEFVPCEVVDSAEDEQDGDICEHDPGSVFSCHKGHCGPPCV